MTNKIRGIRTNPIPKSRKCLDSSLEIPEDFLSTENPERHRKIQTKAIEVDLKREYENPEEKLF